MGARVTQLAKISRPQVHKVLLRERLFARLDETRQHPVTWISAPPGAGKTTTVVSYLDSRKIGGLWYQLDRDDADPATFCYFLGVAARQSGRRKRALPLLTPEYLADLKHFSRRFFRDLFGRTRPGQVLVLDNFQEVPENSPFHDVVEAGLDEIPDGTSVIIVSRIQPPQNYSRLIANRRIALLGWDAMRLTLEEVHGIAGLSRSRAEAADWVLEAGDLKSLYEHSGGWCAGLVLLLEHALQGKAVGGPPQSGVPHEIFDYFASQLFDRLPRQNRDTLLRLVFLPRMRIADAVALSGNADAGKLLDLLYRRHLFTDRRDDASSRPSSRAGPTRAGEEKYVYQFHALFRAFLHEQARSLLAPDEIRVMQTRAGQLLRESAEVESAFELFREAADWANARNVIVGEAEKLVGEGRWKSLVAWIEQMPADLVNEDPWLLHWRGIAQIASAPVAARAALDRAYQAALLRSDRLCAIQCVAGMVETHVLEYTDLRACDKWLPILDEAFSQSVEFASLESEARVLAAFLNGLVYRDPGNSNIERYVSRAMVLFDSKLNANLRASLSVPLNYWGMNCGRLDVAMHVISTLEPMLPSSEITDLRKGLFCYAAVHYYSFLNGDGAKTAWFVKTMEELATQTGFTFIASWAAHCAGAIGAQARDAEACATWLRKIDLLITERIHDRALRATVVALWVCGCAGDPRLARSEALHSLELIDRVGLIPHQFFNLIALLWAASEMQDIRELEHWAAFATDLAASTRIDLYMPCVLAAQAKTYCAVGLCERGERALRSVLDWARRGRAGLSPAAFLSPWMRDLCELALAYGIEMDYAKQVIRDYHYKPRNANVVNWPWPIRIFTLGEFRIVVDDRPLRHSRKSPKRLLLLLKALVAHGAQNVPLEQLIDSLWPDSEGDTAHLAIAVAIRRLRELLGHEEAVLLKGGRLSLNPNVCWVDAIAFEATLQTGGRSEVQRALALYKGSFLANEASEPWAFSCRDRLHGKFVHYANSLARELEDAGDWEAAERSYLRGLDVDDIAESFYQGLIRCHLARGKRAEARRVYDRMGRRLMEKLGMKPSLASVALYGALLAE